MKHVIVLKQFEAKGFSLGAVYALGFWGWHVDGQALRFGEPLVERGLFLARIQVLWR